jgi:polynucleotide 5'-hydroxyl-kinase GRC3/NOL9
LASKKVVLVRGGFDSVEWAYLEDLYAEDSEKKNGGTGEKGEKGGKDEDVKARPWVARKEMVGIEGAVWRLRHPPTAAQVNGGGR